MQDKDVVAVGKEFLAAFADQELSHPALFGSFRKVLGLTDPVIPIEEGKRLDLPVDDQAYSAAKQFFELNVRATQDAKDIRDLRKFLLATLGSCAWIRFPDGSTVKRSVVSKQAHTVAATTYDAVRVDMR